MLEERRGPDRTRRAQPRSAALQAGIQVARKSLREDIVRAGYDVIYKKGYAEASVRDIVAAAGVPQGSFTNHFPSKEHFGREVLRVYDAQMQELVRSTLGDPSRSPLERLISYVDAITTLVEGDVELGCMYGNSSAEASEERPGLRADLVDALRRLTSSVRACAAQLLQEAQTPASLSVEDFAGFFVSSLQGGVLMSKAHRDPKHLRQVRASLVAMFSLMGMRLADTK